MESIASPHPSPLPSEQKGQEEQKVSPKRPFRQTIEEFMAEKDDRQKRPRLLAQPFMPLSLRPKDKNGYIIFRLAALHQNLPANRPGLWKKKEETKEEEQTFPDAVLDQIFSYLAQDWSKHARHFKTVAHGRDVSLWQGCKCCSLPAGLFVNKLARFATMDVMRLDAEKSDGTNHIVVKIMGPFSGLLIKDFGRGQKGEAFYRPVFKGAVDITDVTDEKDESMDVDDKTKADDKPDAMDVDDEDVDMGMDDLTL